MQFIKVFLGDGDMENMENMRRVVAVEVEDPPPELYAVEEPHRRIVEEVAAYVAERGDTGEGEVRRAVRPLKTIYRAKVKRIRREGVSCAGCYAPRMWLCGRLVYEGLPDGEWALLEVVSSAAPRCLVSGSAYTAIGTESHSAVTTSSDERPMAG
jgi:hypothetical protein